MDMEHLEKAYYWNEDQEAIPIKKDSYFLGATLAPKSLQKKYKKERLINLKTPASYNTKTSNKFHFSTGWSGIEKYFKQCALSESNNYIKKVGDLDGSRHTRSQTESDTK